MSRRGGFFRRSDGAVTTDFVVLCAGVIVLASATVQIFADSGDVLSDIIKSFITK
ncbi:hypothetical protein [Brevirhabdus sp.]|uniref:hypothetical protein n=1 Tax=Brevirhabdus sp. TaxID=2004514 RepID=UPI0040596C8E